MKFTLAQFLTVIDGGEQIRITNTNTHETLYQGKKYLCPYFDVYVCGVWTNDSNIVIEVA